jgi:hypothetical protein
MSSHSDPVLFNATRSALRLPCPIGGLIPLQFDLADFCKSNLDKNFWILRELGRHVVLVEQGANLPDFGRCPEEIPI